MDQARTVSGMGVDEHASQEAAAAAAAEVGRLRSFFLSGKSRSFEWRREQLRGMSRLLCERKRELVDAIVADLRRQELQAGMLDLMPTRSEVEHALKHLKRWMRPRRVKTGMAAFPGRSWVQYEPLGVVLVISPWNYPVHLALAPMVAALAAGNCVIVKPSEITASCSSLLADILPRYIDPAAVAVLEGGPEVTRAILDQGVDHCFFTGSTAVGRIVMKAAAEHLTPVTLELGGKCPVIVTKSANLGVAARRIAWGKLANSGQTCVAPDYVLVNREVRDAFVGELCAALDTFCEGRAVPIVNSLHASRLKALLDGAGGVLVRGGTVDIEASQMQPTITVDPDPASQLMQEEIFGPILPVITMDGLDEGIAFIRNGPRPLASYLFSEDANEERHFLNHVISGGAVINHTLLHLAVPDLPFGGVGYSGTGHYHGHWGFETFSHPKAVLRKPTFPEMTFIYPPYAGWKKKLLERGI